MNCPTCSGKLYKYKTPDAAYLICDSCFGHYFLEAQIKKLHKPNQWDNIIAKATPVKSKRKIPCIKCKEDMVEIKVSNNNQKVKIDRCNSCKILWLDQDEIEELQPPICDLENALHKETIIREIEKIHLDSLIHSKLAEVYLDSHLKDMNQKRKELRKREKPMYIYNDSNGWDFFDDFLY